LTTAATLTNLTARGVTQAQIDATRTFLLSLTGETPRRQDQRLILPKIDWNINSSNTLSFTYNRLRSTSPNGVQTPPTVTRGRSSFGDDFVNIDYGIFRLNSTFNPTVLNEMRVKFGKEDLFQFSTPPLPGEPTTGLNGRSPSVAITGGLTFGKPNFLERLHNPLEKTFQIVDNILVSRGNHSFKFGVDFLRTRDLLDNLFQEGGVYAFNNLPDFIVDYVNFANNGALRALSASTPTTNPLGRCSTSTRRAGQCYTSNYAQGLVFMAQSLTLPTGLFTFRTIGVGHRV